MVKFLSKVTYSSGHRQPSAPVIKYPVMRSHGFQFYKNLLLAVLFGSNGNSYEISSQLGMSNKYRDAGSEGRNKTKWEGSECRVPRKVSAALDSSALV